MHKVALCVAQSYSKAAVTLGMPRSGVWAALQEYLA